jgi:hypothetical protein
MNVRYLTGSILVPCFNAVKGEIENSPLYFSMDT